MKIISPYTEILQMDPGAEILKRIAFWCGNCYKSEDKITDESAETFVRGIIKSGHDSVIEHASATVLFVCDRGVSHEIVRHRIASYSQESTRYCNYEKSKFGNELTFILPIFWYKHADSKKEHVCNVLWEKQMLEIEKTYLEMIRAGASAQEARSILPNSLKTELVVTMNMRAWRHFFKLRCATAAHPQMRELIIPLLEEFKKRIPVIFDDINP
jgi:thymidylate synthase (FAD)